MQLGSFRGEETPILYLNKTEQQKIVDNNVEVLGYNEDGSVTVTGTMTDTTKNAVIYLSPKRVMDYRSFQGCILSGGLSKDEFISFFSPQNAWTPFLYFLS